MAIELQPDGEIMIVGHLPHLTKVTAHLTHGNEVHPSRGYKRISKFVFSASPTLYLSLNRKLERRERPRLRLKNIARSRLSSLGGHTRKFINGLMNLWERKSMECVIESYGIMKKG